VRVRRIAQGSLLGSELTPWNRFQGQALSLWWESRQAAREVERRLCWFDNLAEVSIHGQAIVLCHYALRVWNRSNRGSWHLYGHSHGRLPEMPTSLSMDVGIDTHEFRPWHYDEIVGVMEKKSEAQKESRT